MSSATVTTAATTAVCGETASRKSSRVNHVTPMETWIAVRDERPGGMRCRVITVVPVTTIITVIIMAAIVVITVVMAVVVAIIGIMAVVVTIMVVVWPVPSKGEPRPITIIIGIVRVVAAVAVVRVRSVTVIRVTGIISRISCRGRIGRICALGGHHRGVRSGSCLWNANAGLGGVL